MRRWLVEFMGSVVVLSACSGSSVAAVVPVTTVVEGVGGIRPVVGLPQVRDPGSLRLDHFSSGPVKDVKDGGWRAMVCYTTTQGGGCDLEVYVPPGVVERVRELVKRRNN